MDHKTDWSQARNILCVRLDNLGDVLMTTPALKALKSGADGRRLTLLASPAGAAMARMIPCIDEVIVYDAPWMKATAPRPNPEPEFDMVRRLREGGFDGAVIFTVFTQSPFPAAFLCYLAGIERRLAYCHENPYQMLTDWVPDREPAEYILHEVRRQLALVRTIGCMPPDEEMTLRIPSACRDEVERMMIDLDIDENRPWAVIHPGASAPSRRYPPEHFIAAARRLAQDEGWQLVFTGSADEAGLVEEIRLGMEARSWSLAGRLRLDELAALLERAPILVSNNTGPVHMAAALGTPVVDLYAPINPQQHTPWKVPNRTLFHDVPCRHCYKAICPEGHHHCLRLLMPETVVAAALDLYRETQAYSGRWQRIPAAAQASTQLS